MLKEELRKAIEQPQTRELTLTREQINAADRTIELAFSSETPVIRYWAIEILSHDPNAVRLGRINSAGALLMNHDSTDMIGVIDSAMIDANEKMCRAKVRLSKSARAEEVLIDVVDGIRKNVSVGYMIHAMEQMKPEDMPKDLLEMSAREQLPVMIATDWEPLEVSFVSIPADVKVGVGREIKITNQSSSRKENVMPDTVEKTPEEIRKADRLRVAEIDATATRFSKQFKPDNQFKDINAFRNAAVDGDWTIEKFRSECMARLSDQAPVQTAKDMGDEDLILGMSPRELRKYSIVRAINQLATRGQLDGIEKEASDATAKRLGLVPNGFFIAQDVMRSSMKQEKRDLTTMDSTKGGYTVGTDVLAGDMIELLRNMPLVSQLGARTLSGLKGNVAIPKVTGGATAYWLSSNGAVPKSDQGFGQLALTPHRLVGDTAYDKELLIQSSIDIEAFVRQDLMTVLAIEKDRAAINGLGAAGEPRGILNTTGLATSVTFGAAATWAKILEFETNVANGNALTGSVAYLTTPSVRGKWKGISKVTNAGLFLWEGNTVNGSPAAATLQVPSDLVLYGNFNDLILAEWAGIDVVVDPFSLKKNGQIEVTITLWCDIGIRHPASFCKSTDSGAQ